MRQISTQIKDKLLEAGSAIAAAMGVQMTEPALGTLM
jgi:antitoxin component of RelBE/YafQ-DinJ toxin-antitoxin module